VAATLATGLQAQASPDSIKRRNDCRLAEQVIRTGHPAPRLLWASQVLRTCTSAGPSIADAMTTNRLSTDTAFLNAATYPTIQLRDGEVYRAALAVAGDKTASIPARVLALRTLVWTLEPGGSVSYAELSDELPEGRRRRCNSLGAHLHLQITRGAPIPNDYAEAIHRLARGLENDPTEPRQIQRAAVCAQQPALDLTRF